MSVLSRTTSPNDLPVRRASNRHCTERHDRLSSIVRLKRLDHAGERGGHGLADGRAHHREQRVGHRLGIAPDGGGERFFERRGERPGEVRILRALQQDGRQHLANVARARLAIVEARLQRGQALTLGPHEDVAQRRQSLEVRVAIGGGHLAVPVILSVWAQHCRSPDPSRAAWPSR